MTTQVANRLTRLEAKHGKRGADMTCQDMVRLFDALGLRDPAPGAPFPEDQERYRACCKWVGPGVNWPDFEAMKAIWYQADELLAGEAAAGRV